MSLIISSALGQNTAETNASIRPAFVSQTWTLFNTRCRTDYTDHLKGNMGICEEEASSVCNPRKEGIQFLCAPTQITSQCPWVLPHLYFSGRGAEGLSKHFGFFFPNEKIRTGVFTINGYLYRKPLIWR